MPISHVDCPAERRRIGIRRVVLCIVDPDKCPEPWIQHIGPGNRPQEDNPLSLILGKLSSPSNSRLDEGQAVAKAELPQTNEQVYQEEQSQGDHSPVDVPVFFVMQPAESQKWSSNHEGDELDC